MCLSGSARSVKYFRYLSRFNDFLIDTPGPYSHILRLWLAFHRIQSGDRKHRALAVANFAGIAAVAKSVERLLNACFVEEPPVEGKTTHAFLVRTTDLDPDALATSLPTPA